MNFITETSDREHKLLLYSENGILIGTHTVHVFFPIFSFSRLFLASRGFFKENWEIWQYSLPRGCVWEVMWVQLQHASSQPALLISLTRRASGGPKKFAKDGSRHPCSTLVWKGSHKTQDSKRKEHVAKHYFNAALFLKNKHDYLSIYLASYILANM